MYRELRIAVAVPAHNEGRLIRRMLEAVPAFVDEIVVVDDASADDTATEIRRAAMRDRRIHGLERVVKRGGGDAPGLGESGGAVGAIEGIGL